MEDYAITLAAPSDAGEIHALYQSLTDMPDSTWNEEYPSREIVEHDLAHNTVLVMRGEKGRIISSIVIEEEDDEEFSGAAAWYDDVTRWAALARLGVDKRMQGRGIAKRMLLCAMDICRGRGVQAVRFLVSRTNPAPQRAYAKLNFDVCGETELYGLAWLCYQKRL